MKTMSAKPLMRVSGLSAIAGAILWTVSDAAEYFLLPREAAFSLQVATGAWPVIFLLNAVAQLLVLFGLGGLYLHQAREAGLLGLIAFLVTFVGSVLLVGQLWALLILAPELAQAAPEFLDADPPARMAFGLFIPVLLFTLGWLLFGAASLRAGVYPRLAAILWLLGTLLGPVTGGAVVLIPAVAEAVFGAGMAWMGYRLWAEADKPALLAHASSI